MLAHQQLDRLRTEITAAPAGKDTEADFILRRKVDSADIVSSPPNEVPGDVRLFRDKFNVLLPRRHLPMTHIDVRFPLEQQIIKDARR